MPLIEHDLRVRLRSKRKVRPYQSEGCARKRQDRHIGADEAPARSTKQAACTFEQRGPAPTGCERIAREIQRDDLGFGKSGMQRTERGKTSATRIENPSGGESHQRQSFDHSRFDLARDGVARIDSATRCAICESAYRQQVDRGRPVQGNAGTFGSTPPLLSSGWRVATSD